MEGFAIFLVLSTLIGGAIFSYLWSIPKMLGNCFMYKKTGTAQWKAFIPIYNDYTLYKVADSTMLFWINFGVEVLNFLVGVLIVMLTGGNNSSAMLSQGASILFSIVTLVVSIFMRVRLTRKFNKAGWWIAGMIFFPTIMSFVFAFSDDIVFGDNNSSSSEEYATMDQQEYTSMDDIL